MNSEEFYKIAYSLHYKEKNKLVAYYLYSLIETEYAGTQEANYAKTQIENIKNDPTLSFSLSLITDEIKSEAEQIIQQVNQKMIFKTTFSLKDFLMTTGFTFEGFKISKYYNPICADTAIGAGFFNLLKANIADMFGEITTSISSQLQAGREIALKQLIAQAIDLGANALIGIDYDYTIFNNSISIITVSGTAVTVEKIPEIS